LPAKKITYKLINKAYKNSLFEATKHGVLLTFIIVTAKIGSNPILAEG